MAYRITAHEEKKQRVEGYVFYHLQATERAIETGQLLMAYGCIEPDGIDRIPGSSTIGQPFQVSYGMNYVTGGPNGKRLTDLINGNGSSNIVIVWDHGRTPGCADSTRAAPRGPWMPFSGGDANTIHYPLRHVNVFNVLFCDGHVLGFSQSELKLPLFHASGPES